jgi:hypothetical protein
MNPPLVVEKTAGNVREAFAALGLKPDKQPLGVGRPRFTDKTFKRWIKDVNKLYKRVQDSISDHESMRKNTYSDLEALLEKHGPQIWGMVHALGQLHENILCLGESDYYCNELRYPRDKDTLVNSLYRYVCH